MVATQQRFTRTGLSCPICKGHKDKKQGQGERCAGYISKDLEYAFCTREEYAGQLERHENTEPATFCHKLYGPCKCGQQHNPAKATASSNGHKPQKKIDEKRISDEYSYYKEDGKLAYQAVRYEPKGFSQRRPSGGDWLWNMEGVTRVPYRLPELQKAPLEQTVYICEGEKAVEAARKLGVIATTNVGGAEKWKAEYNYSKYFKGRHVVILPDNDEAGKKHAKQVYQDLRQVAASVKVVELPDLPEKGDIVEWIAAGGTKEKLEALHKPPKRKFTYASEIQPKEYEWIWEDRLAKGEFTLAVGDAGVGKGLTTTRIIAQVTKGNPLPGDTKLFPGGVILMSPEDSEEHTLVPRLMAAGADLSKVLLLNRIDETDPETGRTYKRPVSFPEDTAILIEAIEDAHASLIVIDPILSMLSDRVDAHKNHAVRRAVGQVLDAARENNCALFGVMHTTKTQHPNVLFRSSSSSAFIEMARCALFFVPDPDGEQGQSGVIVNYKNNLRKEAPHIRYAIHQSNGNIGYITWEGVSTHSKDELLNQETSESIKPKSAQELDLLTVLKVNQKAMTVSQIFEKIQSGQTLDALEVMLRRKVEQGVLMKPSRGLYTCADNPLYCATSESTASMSEMSNLSDVGIVGITETDMIPTMSESKNGHKPASQGMSQETDISDMSVERKPAPGNGKIIAQMISQGIPYPKKCGDKSHRGDTRWLPYMKPQTQQWEWQCCLCVQV